MRLAVTGARGLLGVSLIRALERAGHEVQGLDLRGEDGVDILDRHGVRSRFRAFAPDRVLHLAAWRDVDRAESKSPETFQINAEGTRVVAGEATRAGASILYLSTDYVFDGASRTPYRESDLPAPLSVYGRSKLAGEEAIQGEAKDWTIVRSAWLFGPQGGNFVDTILDRLETRDDAIPVVEDQRGSPTYAPDLAAGLVELIGRSPQGILHLVNAGEASWFELARAVARLGGFAEDRIHPIPTARLGRPAPRPPYSVLDCRLAGERYGVSLRPWPEALAEHVTGRLRKETP